MNYLTDGKKILARARCFSRQQRIVSVIFVFSSFGSMGARVQSDRGVLQEALPDWSTATGAGAGAPGRAGSEAPGLGHLEDPDGQTLSGCALRHQGNCSYDSLCESALVWSNRGWYCIDRWLRFQEKQARIASLYLPLYGLILDNMPRFFLRDLFPIYITSSDQVRLKWRLRNVSI